MSISTEALARDREQNFVLGDEHRFPLVLTGTVPSQWDAYESAIQQVWDPEAEAPWEGFDPDLFTADQREAGALVWSHRAWIDYPAIAESEAVLVRACIEPGISVDFKYCLSMRAVERARSTDLAHILATRLGGFRSSPAGPELRSLLNDDLVRRALHARTDLDAFVAAHLIGQGTIDLAMWRASIDHAHPTIAHLAALAVRDKARMVEVAWAQLGERVPQRDDADRRLIAATVTDVLADEECKGRQVPALLGPGEDRDLLTAAHERAAEGLGGIPAERQIAVARQAMSEVADRLLALGVVIEVPR